MGESGSHIDAAQASADDQLVGELRRIASEIDAVPDDVRAAAQAAITTRDLDSELAALVADSAAPIADSAPHETSDPTSPAFEPVRSGSEGAGGSRLLSFAGSGVQVDLEVTERGGRLDLIGVFTGASTDGCVLEFAAGERHVLDVDTLGRFIVNGVGRGPVRARCRSTAGARIITAWVTI